MKTISHENNHRFSVDMFDLPTSVTVSGCEYPIRTDFRVILEIFVMLDDPDLTDADKTAALLRMFYVRREASPEGNRPPDAEAALQAFTDFVDPRHGNQGKTSSGRLIDWSQDFDLMVAPINHILGFECRASEYLHWRTFLSAYLEIPPESIDGYSLFFLHLLYHKRAELSRFSWLFSSGSRH